MQEAARCSGLTDLLDRQPRQLSGGQRQRVALGRAIVRHPTVFLFDEPLSNLDAKLRVQMRTEIKALHQRLKTTTVYVTHDQVEAMTMADRIVVMRDGRIEQVGDPLMLYDHPSNLFVAGFIGSPAMNFIQGTVKGSHFTSSDGLAFAVNGEPGMGDRDVMLGIRPEHLELHPDGAEVEISVVEQTGSEMYVSTEIGRTRLNCLLRERRNLKPGERIRLRPQGERVPLFDPATGDSIG